VTFSYNSWGNVVKKIVHITFKDNNYAYNLYIDIEETEKKEKRKSSHARGAHVG
jgi:hypothetical protein